MGEKTKKKGSISYAKWGYIFIAPFFIIFAVFQLVPLASTIYYSFFEYYRSGLKIIGPNFVGLKNYITLFATDLPKYFGNTLILWIIGFIPQIIVSLLLAAWFTDLRLKLKGQTFFKTVIYMPNLIMASAFSMLFFTLFSNVGPINQLTGQREVAGNGSAEAEYDLAVERTVIYFVFSGSRIGSLRSTRGCRDVVGRTGCYGKDHNQRQEQCG